MSSTLYREYTILSDGYCFYVTHNGDEHPLDTLADAQAFIDHCRAEQTLNAMAKNWYK